MWRFIRTIRTIRTFVTNELIVDAFAIVTAELTTWAGRRFCDWIHKTPHAVIWRGKRFREWCCNCLVFRVSCVMIHISIVLYSVCIASWFMWLLSCIPCVLRHDSCVYCLVFYVYSKLYIYRKERNRYMFLCVCACIVSAGMWQSEIEISHHKLSLSHLSCLDSHQFRYRRSLVECIFHCRT